MFRLPWFASLFSVFLLTGLTVAVADEDSVVVFNEINYHPDDTGVEWIELRSLMGVNVDISGWKVRGGIDYDFPEGTVIPSRGYIVIAANPNHASLNGVGAVGPFSGALNNAGEEIWLENRDGRVMDRLEYSDHGDWPVAADGSGVTLAKANQESATSEASGWTISAEIGGTPGRSNFAIPGEPPVETTASTINSEWVSYSEVSAPPANWKNPDFDDSSWAAGAGIFYAGTPTIADGGGGVGLLGYWPLESTSGTNVPNAVSGGVNGTLVNGTAWVNDPDRGRVLQFDGTNDYADLGSTTIPQMTLSNSFTWSFWARTTQGVNASVMLGNRFKPNEPNGTDWSPREFIKFTNDKFEYHREGAGEDLDYAAIPTNTWVHHVMVKSGNTLMYYRNGVPSGSRTITKGLNNPQPLYLGSDRGNEAWAGRIDDVAIWSRALSLEEVQQLASGAKNPGNIGAVDLGTELPLGRTTYYFRREFNFSGLPSQASLRLRHLLDDGAVIYLNGEEIYRVNMPAGAPSHSTLASPAVGDAAISSVIDVPATGLQKGTNVIAVEVHQASAESSDMVFGLELKVIEEGNPLPDSAPSLVINEMSAGGAGFQMEIANHGSSSVDLTGYVIASSSGNSYTLGATTLSAGGLLVLDQSQLGFAPQAGNGIFVYRPGKSALVDARKVETTARARTADGRWLTPTSATFGSPNTFELTNAIVINEIMYHPRPTTPGVENTEQWIELYNRSQDPVDLSGWQLADAVTYVFPQGTILNPGGYLVVARNAAALQAKYPSITILGNWSGRLSHGSERILLLDSAGNPADEVTYYDSGRWPEYADGYGSSLELRDPNADNSRPEAWAASDESTKSQWHQVTYQGTATNFINDPTQFNEFIFGLLDAGDFLIDDISVKEVNVSNRECIQNGDFSGGTFGTWRLLGTHRHATIVDDPDSPGNKVLRIRATGASEHMHNHAETTLRSGGTYVTINSSNTYVISFRARWMGGCNLLNSRLYFNRLARTTALPVPTDNGTPGAPNSRLEPNIGPTYSDLSHSPVVPEAGQPAQVRVKASDPDNVATMTLFYSVNGGGWLNTPMSQNEGYWVGTIPGQAASARVQFYVRGIDGGGAISFYPAGGLNSRAMIPWQDGQAQLQVGSGHRTNVRIVMTPSDVTYMHTNVNVMSNDRLGATVIRDEREVYYDVGVRLKGSQRGRPKDVRVGFNIRFSPDQKFLGAHEAIAVDRSGAGDSSDRKFREILTKHAINHAGGIPGMYDDVIRIIAPSVTHTGTALLQKSRFNDEWLDNRWPDGSNGRMFEYELIYYPTKTNTGGVEGLKVPEDDATKGQSLGSLGPDKELYRWHYMIKNNRSEDDYSRLIQVVAALGQVNNAFTTQTKAVLDVDQWLRAFAVQVLFGVSDSFSAGGQHNAYFFIRPTDGRGMYFPWDMDFSFQRGVTESVTDGGILNKFTTDPGNRRAYYGHLLDLCTTTFNTTYLTPWAQHYSLYSGDDLTWFMGYVNDRRNSVLGQINTAIPPTAFAITTANGSSFSGPFATIRGTAWVNMRELRVQGTTFPLNLTWLTDRTWEAQVPILNGANNIVLEAVGFDGSVIGTSPITVNGTGLVAPANATNLVISEIMYHPVDPSPAELADGFTDSEAFEFLEIQNISSTETVHLGGLAFTNGIDFTFPAVTLAPGERAVIVSNTAAFVRRYGNGPRILGQYEGQLSNSGERLVLRDGLGDILRDLTYMDNLPWPASADGEGFSLVLINPTSNPSHEPSTAWRASAAVGGSPGGSDAVPFAGSPLADDDGDGIVNLLQYAMGKSGQYFAPQAGQQNGAMTISVRRALGADDASLTIQRSTDLETWDEGQVTLVSEVNHGDGTATYTWRSNYTVGANEREFLRVVVTMP